MKQAQARPKRHRLSAQGGRIWRRLWPSPWTLLGFLLGALVLAFGGSARLRQGALEFSGGAIGRLAHPNRSRLEAITLGHVILGCNATVLDDLRAHEQAHVKQYERWGLLFVPAYLGASLWLWLRGGEPYWDNPFERAARAAERPGERVN